MVRYAFAVAAVAGAAMLHWWWSRAFDSVSPFIVFFPAVIIVANVAGSGPGLVAAILSTLAAVYFFLAPLNSFAVASATDLFAVAIFAGTNVFTCVLAERLPRSRSAAAMTRQKELLAVTLASIGDGVIVADTKGRVSFLNDVAERLTGWTMADAQGQPFPSVFRIIDEQSRQPVEKAERLKQMVGCSGNTLLIAKDGREIYIDESSAQVREAGQKIQATVVVFRDCTERRQAEALQRTQSLLLETVVNHLPAAICLIRGDDLKLQFVNPVYQAIAPEAFMVGKTLDELWPDTGQRFGDICQRVLTTGEPHHVVDELNMIRRSQQSPPEAGYFTWSMFRVRLPDDEGWGLLLTALDTTASKLAEIALRESELRFRTLVDAISQLAWTARADGYIDWYNQRWYEYTGTTPQDMEGWGWQSVHDKATLPVVLEGWKASIATGEPFVMVFPLRGADGRFRSFLTRVQPLKDLQGRVVQWFGTNTDVEELQRADAAHARLAAIVESSDDAILSKRLDGTILTWNAAAERLFGYSADEIIGESISLLVPPDRADEEANIIARLRRGEECDHIETVRITKDGRKIDVSVTISPLKDRDGNVVGASKIARDITDRKRAQEAVAAAMQAAEQAKTVAEAANKTKDRFIAILSHELRTPLNPVLISASMLLKDCRFDRDVREQLEMICRNVEMETRLIDDLLDVTRIEHGKIELNRHPVELGAILRRVMETCNPDVVAKNLDLIVNLSDAPVWVDGDAARLQQILWNVIRNAIKFTPAGSTVRIRAGGSEEGFALIQVTDSGIGIDPTRLGRIFNAFEQADGSITRKFGGIGLGLAISKAMVELHGGTISAHSDGDGKGATFDVRLPLASRGTIEAIGDKGSKSAGAETHLREQPIRALQILLVEDDADTARIMSRLLRAEGHRIDHAPNVTTALQLLGAKHFDLLVSDLGLPDGNGWDIMRGLRERGSNLPGIALSGYGQDADIQNSLAAGYSSHLTKPVNIGVLMTKIREIGEKLAA